MLTKDERWKSEREYYERLTPSMQEKAKNVFRTLEGFLHEKGIPVITKNIAPGYIDWLLKVKKYSSTTVRVHLSVLNKWHRETLEANTLIGPNPWSQISVQKPAPEPTPGATPEQAKRLLEHARNPVDRAVWALAFGAALRVSEAANLKVLDVIAVPVPHVILRQTKSREVQRVALSPVAWENLKPLLASKSKFVNENLFTSKFQVTNRFNKLCARADLTHLSFHSGRVTAITQLLNQGADVYEVSRFARHKAISTTMIYDRRRREITDSAGLKLAY